MVNSRKAFSYFSSGWSIKKSTNGWWSFDCPFCVKKRYDKIAVNFEYQHVKCYLCGFGGSIEEFVMQAESLTWFAAKNFIQDYDEVNIDFEEVAAEVEQSDVTLPIGYTSLLEGQGIISSRARDYIFGRGFDLDTMDKFGIGYVSEHLAIHKEDDYYGYIILPFRRRGKLIYYIGRDFMGQFLRYKNPATETFGIGKADLLFNEDALELKEEVSVHEGVFDAMTMGSGGIATLGWSWSAYQKSAIKRSKAKRIILIPDAGEDNGGMRFYHRALQLASELIDFKEVIVVDFDISYLSSVGKDVNAVGKERVMKVVKELSPITFSDIMKQLT